MELKLAEGEMLIKSWDYAIAGNTMSKDKQQLNLTLTNKRLVSSNSNSITLAVTETPLDVIKGFSGNYAKNRSFWPKVKLVLGIIFCVAIVGLILVFGIRMIKNALAALRACKFELTFYTNVMGKEFNIMAWAAADQVQKKGFFARLFHRSGANKFKVYVNKEIARDVLNEIGGAILNAQAVKYEA